MHVFRACLPEGEGLRVVSGRGERRRPDSAEVSGVARCPRCRAVLVAAVGRGRPEFFCRCLGRMPLPAASGAA